MIRRLGSIVLGWLEEPGAAAVGLNELHPNIAQQFLRDLRERAESMNVRMETNQPNSLLWCAPQLST